MGLIGTMSALILGPLIASADSSYKAQKNELQTLSANIVLVDRLLASYGADTKKAREELRSAIRGGQERIWSGGRTAAGEYERRCQFHRTLAESLPEDRDGQNPAEPEVAV
ncbi:hypothetical protein LMG27198_46050 [Methylocystis echinoides]|uniref:Uncharacterized protein n=2 Tax=Methylocystis echinoides TaxID=29468 RepID=A0A9W6GZ32_9HYPH|nr:hypothetical protein LMG27198_46050 [Methylocystis echinoides]